jgi:hypothetical protein
MFEIIVHTWITCCFQAFQSRAPPRAASSFGWPSLTRWVCCSSLPMIPTRNPPKEQTIERIAVHVDHRWDECNHPARKSHPRLCVEGAQLHAKAGPSRAESGRGVDFDRKKLLGRNRACHLLELAVMKHFQCTVYLWGHSKTCVRAVWAVGASLPAR